MADFNNNSFRKNNYSKDYNNDDKLPMGYLEGGYYNDVNGKMILKKEYIIKYSQEISKKLSKERNKNKSSQIRKYYDYCIRIREQLRINGEFSMVEAELARLKPFVEYAKTRGTVSQLFVDFISSNIESIKKIDDFTAFVKHFESIVAYLPKDNN